MHILTKSTTWVTILALLLTACSLFNKNKTQNISTMTGDYPAEWKIVDSLLAQQLPKSALEKVESILTRARSENNTEQTLKAVIHQANIIQDTEEDGWKKAFVILETEEKTSQQPAKSILQSVLAHKYADYLSNNGWNLSQRTPIPDGEGGDMSTWSAAQLEQKIVTLYLGSVQESALLANSPVQNYPELISKGRRDTLDQKQLRPTLLDVLSQKAIDYLRNERSYLNEPVYAFVLDQTAAFAQPEAFASAVFESKDLNSGKWRTLQLFQQLTSAHLKNGNNGALLTLTLQRLQFALQNSNRNDRNQLYAQALEQALDRWKSSEGSTEIMYAQAMHVGNEKTSPTPEQNSAASKKAVAICQKAIAAYPNSYGAKQCNILLNGLKKPSLNVQSEEHLVPEQPNLLSVIYKNVASGSWKIVAVKDRNRTASTRRSDEDYLQKLFARPAVASSVFNVKDPEDYLEHTTELALPALPVGRYAIFISDKKVPASFDDVSDFAMFTCTNMASIGVRHLTEASTEFWLVNRQTGQAMPGVQAALIQEYWENNFMAQKTVQTYVTNKDGKITIEGNDKRNLSLVYTMGKDTFDSGSVYNYYEDDSPAQNYVEFFTDRTLYRPGQLVYFKGIVLRRDEKGRPSIQPKTSVTVVLRDANDQERERVTLTANQFGTFNGAFTLPTGGLTGSFTLSGIDGAYGTNYFQVEEYKRPKFEVSFEAPEGSYRLNDEVTVKGAATNYAGNPTDGATVNWRVFRRTWTPSWWYRCGGGWFDDYGQEVAMGTAVTNAEGKFEVRFKAIPNAEPEDKYPPAFEYEISADVTDNTGETRSSMTSVRVGKDAFVLNNNLEKVTILDSLKTTEILANNLADQKVNAKGTIRLQKLDAPQRFFKRRLFTEPDITTIDEKTFRQLFPDVAWNGEHLEKNWKPVGSPLTYSFDTQVSNKVDLMAQQPTPGYYKITMEARDAQGAVIRSEKVVEIRKSALDFVEPAGLVEEKVYQPGQNLQMSLGSAIKDFNALVFLQRQHQADVVSWNTVTGTATKTFGITEDDRGGMSVSWIGIHGNRSYVGTYNINVPYSNKELDVKFETFRDKLQPGSKEEWRLRISGPGKEKAAAEVLAAMYDASLDQYLPFNWSFSPYSQAWFNAPFPNGTDGVTGRNYLYHRYRWNGPSVEERMYPELRYLNQYYIAYAASAPMMRSAAPGMEIQKKSMPEGAGGNGRARMEDAEEKLEVVRNDMSAPPAPPAPAEQSPYPAQIRRNLQETVFFYPELRTDANGDVLLKFTMNEALTRWKLQVLAHTTDLKYAVAQKTVVTQKDLMITANAPRFLRAGDEMEFAAKVSNLTENPATGTASLALMDAATMKPLEKELGLVQPVVNFNVPGKQSAGVRWKITIPADFVGAVTWRIFADSKTGRDGEENSLPVVTNRQLVTETLPMAVRGNQDKVFQFGPLPASGSRTNHRYTLEFTSNPVWYAVQSLPYIMEYPHECSEQLFSRFYANTLASSVTEKMPAIRRVYERWKGTPAMASNLSKNQELKNALLEETPWVMDAQNETQQKQNIALLFDMNRMANEKVSILKKLGERQQNDGGFPWFPGANTSWYITQHIMCGLAHLDRLNAFKPMEDPDAMVMLEKGLDYCDKQAERAYAELEKQVAKGTAKWDDDHLGGLEIQYLYLRSFYPVVQESQAFSYYKKQIGKFWTSKSLHEQGLLALVSHRIGDKAVAQQIVKSLEERATIKEEMGMYWPNNWGMYWYQLPIETQAIMVEVFNEVANNRTAVDNLRIWLLKNKQTNRWESTKATAEAIYALLLTGDNWLAETKPVSISLGNQKINPKEVEAGSGYFKQEWMGSDIKNSWNEVSVKNPNPNIVWGAAYRQYFEDLDKITTFKKTGLTLERGIFLERNSDTGPVLVPLKDGDKIKVGDKLKVRVEIRCDRAMEFVHLKDMRPAGCEPTNVISSYKYQGGLGYYESTKDLATHFFMDYLPRGTFVLEYPLVASHKGNMSFGIASLQSMYAPEFTSHSGGIRIIIE